MLGASVVIAVALEAQKTFSSPFFRLAIDFEASELSVTNCYRYQCS